ENVEIAIFRTKGQITRTARMAGPSQNPAALDCLTGGHPSHEAECLCCYRIYSEEAALSIGFGDRAQGQVTAGRREAGDAGRENRPRGSARCPGRTPIQRTSPDPGSTSGS